MQIARDMRAGVEAFDAKIDTGPQALVKSEADAPDRLIAYSDADSAAWDGVNVIAQQRLRNGEHLTGNLAAWVADRLEGKRKRPAKRGPNPGTNDTRNRAVIYSVQYLHQHLGMNAMRNNTSGGPRACVEGGSACDVVGKVFGLNYKAVEKIWTDSAADKARVRRSPFGADGLAKLASCK